MLHEIEHAIAGFLNTHPEQVRQWDGGVVERMLDHPPTFEAFKTGNDIAKWRIYMGLRRQKIDPA